MVAMTKIVAADSKTGELCLVIPNTREYATCLTYDYMPLCILGALWTQAMRKIISTSHSYIQWNAAISNL